MFDETQAEAPAGAARAVGDEHTEPMLRLISRGRINGLITVVAIAAAAAAVLAAFWLEPVAMGVAAAGAALAAFARVTAAACREEEQ